MKRCLCVLAAGVLAMAAAGCPAMHRGMTLVKWDKGSTSARVTEADSNGIYGLYSLNEVKPEITFRLNRGDKLGFEPGAKGKVIAVAGEHRQELPDNTTYYWNRR